MSNLDRSEWPTAQEAERDAKNDLDLTLQGEQDADHELEQDQSDDTPDVLGGLSRGDEAADTGLDDTLARRGGEGQEQDSVSGGQFRQGQHQPGGPRANLTTEEDLLGDIAPNTGTTGSIRRTTNRPY